MKLVMKQTAFITTQENYEIWKKNRGERPQPILKRIYMKKQVNNVTVVPLVGEAISDGLWDHHSHEVDFKYIDYDKDECDITVTPIYIPVNTPLEREFEKKIQSDGWEIIGIGDGDYIS